MKMLLIAFSVLAVSGCSTTPVSPSSAKNVAVTPFFESKDDTVAVTIVRDKGFVASGCAITAFINGRKVATLDTGEKAVAYVEAGAITIGAGFVGSGLCSGPAKIERDFIIKQGEPKTLRIFIDQSANVDILPTTEPQI